MSVSSRFLRIALALALTTSLASRALADCPASYLKFLSNEPGADHSDGLLISFSGGYLNYSRTGDLLQLSSSSNDSTASARYDYVRVVEAFDVTGVATGTIVNATLAYRLDGSCFQDCGASGCGVDFWGTLRIGPDSVSVVASIIGATPPTTHPLAQTLTLPVTFTAGTPVTVEFLLAYRTGPGQVDANASGNGSWSVTGLPAGVTAVSTCTATVPVHARSWGALKAHYR